MWLRSFASGFLLSGPCSAHRAAAPYTVVTGHLFSLGQSPAEVEFLLAVILEVPHLMIDSESNAAGPDVLDQKRTLLQEIKQNPPARHLRMVIASRMILPEIASPVFDKRQAERPGQQLRAVHK